MLKIKNPFDVEPSLSGVLETPPVPAHIVLAGVEKAYPMGKKVYQALKSIDLRIEPGEFVAIVGPSGSGKSTILNMITGIDRPSTGRVTVGGTRLDQLNENALARWRGYGIGIIFQFFQLLPTLTAFENVILPLHLRGLKSPYQGDERRERAMNNLKMVGLADHADHLPRELSGGEQQRVAIARALANDPPLLVADEPTGNLDTQTGEMIFDIFRNLSDQGKTVVFVTHDPLLAQQARRLIQVRDGEIVSDEPVS